MLCCSHKLTGIALSVNRDFFRNPFDELMFETIADMIWSRHYFHSLLANDLPVVITAHTALRSDYGYVAETLLNGTMS